MNTPVAYVSRHGETNLNKENALKGFLDAPLTDAGMQQAERQAEVLSQVGLTRIFCSPLLRAYQTASFTSEVTGLELIQDRGLATWHVGVFEGVNKDDCKEAIQLFLDNPSIAVPDGESVEQFEDRVAEFFGKWLKRAEMDGPYAFFTHNSDIVALANMLEGKRSATVELGEFIPTGGIAAVYINGDTYRLESIFEPKNEAMQGDS